MIVKSLKMFLLSSLCLQLNFVDCAAGEEKNNKRKREWKDQKVYKNRNFNKAFPELAEGFRLIDENFQDFMMTHLKDHYVYESVEDVSGKQTSLLHNTLEQAEKKMVIAMQKKLKAVFNNKKDLKNSDLNILQYTKDYKYPWGEEITQILKTDEDRLCNGILDGHIKKVETLIDLEVDINVQNGYGWTPLHCAASRGNAPMIARLCSLHADIEAQDFGDQTPLFLAFKNYGKDKKYSFDKNKEYIKSIQFLIAAGAKNIILKNEYIYSDSGLFTPDKKLTREAKKFISNEFAKRDNPSSLASKANKISDKKDEIKN